MNPPTPARSFHPVQDPNDERSFMVNERQLLHNVHDADSCAGEHCVMHNPSDHHMRAWPLWWRDDRKLMERTCPHGVGHPDPDDTSPDHVHGCDGCCHPLGRDAYWAGAAT